MKVIHKHHLERQERNCIDLPIGAEVLSFQIQNTLPTIWVLLDPHEQEYETRVFDMYGTGNIITEEEGMYYNYIGTIMFPVYVWHLFEVTPQ